MVDTNCQYYDLLSSSSQIITNPEFLRQSFKKLAWLSDYVISEHDSASDNYWENHMKFVFGRVQKIAELLEEARNLENTEILTSELYIDPWLMKQENLARRIATDPFLKKRIRNKVANFYSERAIEMGMAYTQVMPQFCIDLYEGKIPDNNGELKIQVWVKLGDVYFKKGWGWDRSSKRIIGLRSEIETYLLNLK